MTTTPQAALLSDDEIERHFENNKSVPGRELRRLIGRSIEAAILAKLQATQEPVQSVPEAMKVVTEAMRSDPDYAWSWHCNVAMASVDEGMGHYEANQAAARFMRLLAGVDTTKHQGFPEAPEQEPAQAGELPPLPSSAHWEERIKTLMQQTPLPNSMSVYQAFKQFQNEFEHATVEYARAALSARKPLPYDLICNAIDLADTESMKGDYMLDSGDCIAVVRTMQALIEINGIGLEVKP